MSDSSKTSSASRETLVVSTADAVDRTDDEDGMNMMTSKRTIEVHTAAAVSFLAGYGRVLDRRRPELLLGGGSAEGVLAALDSYRNPDGGYGWGLEPDLRTAESQPTCAMHAFEVLAEVGPTTSPHAVELCDWLAERSLADGGLPMIL